MNNYITSKTNVNFKNITNVTSMVQQNVVLNRSLLDAGGIIPWLISCNNKEERIERSINMAFFFSLAFFAPLINVPIANRIAMHGMRLTDSLGDNNHKAIQLSNKFLINKTSTVDGLNLYNSNKNNPNVISQKFASSPFEKLYCKAFSIKENNQIEINKLLKKCENNPELLRKRLIKAKNWVLFSDLIITGLTLGSLGFLNNYMTKKRTGQTGFSAEFKMADSSIIEKRATEYEQNKKRKARNLLITIGAISTIVPLAVSKCLQSNSSKPIVKYIKKHADWVDYTKGIFMSRFTMLLGMIMNCTGLILASRNKTEQKDWTIRTLVTNPIFLGGDLLIASLFSNASDKLFKTNLTEHDKDNTLLRKIFPKTKSIEKINSEIAAKKLSPKHKYIASGIYWGNMLLCASALAYLVPAICNKMIKHDVDNDVKLQSKKLSSNKIDDNKSK